MSFREKADAVMEEMLVEKYDISPFADLTEAQLRRELTRIGAHALVAERERDNARRALEVFEQGVQGLRDENEHLKKQCREARLARDAWERTALKQIAKSKALSQEMEVLWRRLHGLERQEMRTQIELEADRIFAEQMENGVPIDELHDGD